MTARGYEALRQELLPGERLIWSGCPRQGVHVRTGWAVFITVVIIIDALLLTMSAIGLITLPPPGVILVLVFATIIVCLIVIDRVRDALRRRFTVYGLTDRRAIVISDADLSDIRSLHLDALVEIELFEFPGQIGTLRCISVPNGWYRRNRRDEIKPIPLFRAIVDPRHVRDLLTDANRDVMARRTGERTTHS